MSEFSVRIDRIDDSISAIKVRGLLDANTFEEFDESLNRVFDGGTYNVAVDFSGLDYISSAGAGVLIGALSIARENGGNIVIAAPQESVREVFNLLGIDQLFGITDGVGEAVDMLRS